MSLTALLEDAQACVSYLSARRDDALRAMRINGASYGSIANVLGVSKTRAQQLVVRLERPHRPAPVALPGGWKRPQARSATIWPARVLKVVALPHAL